PLFRGGPADRTVRQRDPLRIQLLASDPDGDALTYASARLPLGAFLNSTTGLFTWTPAFAQQGMFTVPFAVSDGTSATAVTAVAHITVLHADTPPVFDQVGSFQVEEVQALDFRAFASDPHNPGFIPQDRLSEAP